MNEYLLYRKVDAQFDIWDGKWANIVIKTKKEQEKIVSLSLTDEKSDDTKKALQDIDDLLLHTLYIDDTIDWDTLKDNSKFKVPNPRFNKGASKVVLVIT